MVRNKHYSGLPQRIENRLNIEQVFLNVLSVIKVSIKNVRDCQLKISKFYTLIFDLKNLK